MPPILTCRAYPPPYEGFCGLEAAWTTPAGPRCEKCAQEMMQTIREGSCLLSVMAEQKGISTETLLSRFVRIQ